MNDILEPQKIVPQKPNIYDPQALRTIITQAALETSLCPQNTAICPQTRQLASEVASHLNRPETQEKPAPECRNVSNKEKVTNEQMAQMVRALLKADPGICDVGIQQLVLGTGNLNGSTVMTETNLQRIIDRERQSLSVEQAHQRIVDVRIKVQQIIANRK